MNIIISNPVINLDGGAILFIGVVFLIVWWIKKHNKKSWVTF